MRDDQAGPGDTAAAARLAGGAEMGGRRRAPGPRSDAAGQGLALHRVGDRLLESLRRPPLVGRASGSHRADLVDVPVDLEVVAVGVPELDGDLAAGAAAALEVDRHAPLAQPRAGPEDLVERADLEREVIEAGVLAARRAPDEGDPVVVRVHPEEDHPAVGHLIGAAVADLEAEPVGVDADRAGEVGDVEHDVADLPELELQRTLTSHWLLTLMG